MAHTVMHASRNLGLINESVAGGKGSPREGGWPAVGPPNSRPPQFEGKAPLRRGKRLRAGRRKIQENRVDRFPRNSGRASLALGQTPVASVCASFALHRARPLRFVYIYARARGFMKHVHHLFHISSALLAGHRGVRKAPELHSRRESAAASSHAARLCASSAARSLELYLEPKHCLLAEPHAGSPFEAHVRCMFAMRALAASTHVARRCA